jgi:imidazole glycerol-phosphate synthase subunit HisF
MGCATFKQFCRTIKMLRPRIIPCLLVKNKGLIKTVNFKNPKYIGDPINAVRIFNEKEVDELVVIDIDASVENREPDYSMIEHLASECRMPLCYGGGVKSIDQVQRIVSLGVEKVAISSAAHEDPRLISQAAECIGSQSIVVVIDVKKHLIGHKYDIWIYNGKKNTNENPFEFAKQMEKLGAGEIVVNSINNDGIMKGYDLFLVEKMREFINVPLTVLGGAGSIHDIGQLINKHGIIGAAAGSLFVFKGVYKAVLINYPNRAEKDSLINENCRVL